MSRYYSWESQDSDPSEPTLAEVDWSEGVGRLELQVKFLREAAMFHDDGAVRAYCDEILEVIARLRVRLERRK